MQALCIEDIIKATGGILLAGNKELMLRGITTDSRKAASGTLFIPLAGERFDGHDFIGKAFEAGTDAVITHKDYVIPDGKTVVRVADTFRALGEIAAYYKRKYPVPSVAIVGSVGKTTTKDMVAGVLSTRLSTVKTQGNYNNEIGLPLTVFTIEKEHQAAVLEMGMSGFGEIERLAYIGCPDFAVMTNIGMSHIEKLGSRENIFKAKMEVTKGFGEKNVLIANGDDEFLSKTRGMGPYQVVYYGINNPQNDVYAKDIQDYGTEGVSFTICEGQKQYPVRVHVAGVHNVYNALAAFCTGQLFGVPEEDILRGIANFELTTMRMAVREEQGITTINDCYNAAPDSMKASLAVLSKAAGTRKIAVLGDILELGTFAKEAHLEVGTAAAQARIDLLVTAGENARFIAQGAREAGMKAVHCFKTTQEAAAFAGQTAIPGDVILIKASRGMKFETVYQAVEEKRSTLRAGSGSSEK